MPKFRRLELWTNWRSVAGATRVRAKLPLYAKNGDALKAVLAVDSDESLTAVMSRAVAEEAGLTERQVLALIFSDNSFAEWRIAKLVWTKDTCTATCQSPLLDLNDDALLTDSDPDTGEPIYTWGMAAATVTEVATGILTHDAFVAAGLSAIWSLGTVDSTRTLDDVSVTNGSPLAAFRALQAAIRAAGEPCELRPRVNGTAGYVIDIVREVGSSAAELLLQEGRNLDQVIRTSDTRDQATIVSVLGADLAGQATGVGLARWPVGTITGAGPYTIPLTDPAGGDGPIVADGQFVGDKLLIEKDATTLVITASDATAQTVTVAVIGSLLAGDYVEFRSAAGAQLTALEHPMYVQDPPTGYGRKVGTLTRSSLTGVANLGPNPFQRTWTTPTDPPDGYATKAFFGGTVTTSKNTDPLYTQYGGASWLVTFGATNQAAIMPPISWKAEYTGQRFSARLRCFIKADGFTYWQAGDALELRLGVKLAGGDVHMWSGPSEVCRIVPPNAPQEAVGTRMAGDVFIDLALDGVDITSPSANTADANAVTASDLASNDGFVLVLYFASGTAPIVPLPRVYIDAYMVTVGAAAPSVDLAVSEFGGANQLHQLANLLLSERGQPLASYEATVYDLERKDPAAFAADLLVLGMTVRPRGKAIPSGTRERLTQLEPDYLQPLLTRALFATPRTKLSDLLLGDSTGTGGIASGSGSSSSSGSTSSGGTTGTGNTGATTTGSGGPGSGSSGDTVTPTLTLGITLDISNVPIALADVNDVVTRVKIAGRTDRYPTEDEVRAETSITPGPFTLAFTALADSATEYCAAFAYDAAGNESALALARATAPASTSLPVTGAVLWLKPGEGLYTDAGVTPVAADGDRIYQRNDFSGNDFHYVQTSAPNRPFWRPGVTHRGKGTVKYYDEVNSINTWFNPPDALGVALAALTEAEMWVIFKNRTVNLHGGKRQSWKYGTPTGTAGYMVWGDDGGIVESFGSSTVRTNPPSLGFPPGVELSSQFNAYRVWTKTNDYGFEMNGSLVHSDTANTVAFATSGLLHGESGDGSVFESLDSYESEVVIFDHKLSPTEAAAMLAYALTGSGSGLSPSLSYVIDGGDVIVTCTAPGADSAKMDASTSGTPSDATVRVTAALTTIPFSKTFPAPTGTDVLHVKAFSYAGATESAAATIDISPESIDQAIKNYVDSKVAGLSWKQAVRAATTSAHTLATDFENGDTIDGVTLATGDRILIKDQATASENGIYTVNASGAPTRATDADTGAELVNATVYVSEGTTNADTQWTCTTNAPITVGSTSLAFAQLSVGGSLSVKDEGTTLSTAVTSIDFTGAGVTATNVGGAVTVNVPGGSSSGTGRWDPMALRSGQTASALDDDWSGTGTTLNARWTAGPNWPPTAFDIDTTFAKRLYLRAAGNSTALRTIHQAIPAGDGVFQTEIIVNPNYQNLSHAELLLSDGVGGAANVLIVTNYQDGTSKIGMQSGTMASITSNVTTAPWAAGLNPLVVRIERASGVYTIELSPDGIDGQRFTVTPGFTPSYIGIGGAPFTGDLRCAFGAFRYSATPTTRFGAYL